MSNRSGWKSRTEQVRPAGQGWRPHSPVPADQCRGSSSARLDLRRTSPLEAKSSRAVITLGFVTGAWPCVGYPRPVGSRARRMSLALVSRPRAARAELAVDGDGERFGHGDMRLRSVVYRVHVGFAMASSNRTPTDYPQWVRRRTQTADRVVTTGGISDWRVSRVT